MKMISFPGGKIGPFKDGDIEVLEDRYIAGGAVHQFGVLGSPHSIVDAQPEDMPKAAVPESVTALQGLLAIDAAGMSAAYEAWATHADRTFAEKAFINKAMTWKRDDPVLLAGAAALNLNSDAVDNLFRAAALL